MSTSLFVEDRQGEDVDIEYEKAEEELISPTSAKVVEEAIQQPKKPVWFDEDDEDISISLLGIPRRKKHRKNVSEKSVSGAEYSRRIRDFYLQKGYSSAATAGGWAELPSEKKRREKKEVDKEHVSEEENDSDTEVGLADNVQSLLQSTGNILAKRKRTNIGSGNYGSVSLRSGVLDLTVLRNANEEDPNKAEARCVEFHPSGRLILTAGFDKTVRIFQVEAGHNAKVQGVHVKKFPIHTAKFTGGGTQVVMTGRRRFFHELDMNSGELSTVRTLEQHDERAWEKFVTSADGSKLAFFGQGGKIVLMENKCKQEIGQLRHNGHVVMGAFAPEGECEHVFYSSTLDGTVYVWDARKMECVNRHKDEGAIHSTSLDVCAGHYALGSDSGVVNIYDRGIMSEKTGTQAGIVKPRKSFFNLTTEIDNIAFNSDGQLMAFSSHVKKRAVRIAHIPSMTVYSNWPTRTYNIRRVCAMSFSPGGGYLAVGNDKGDVHMLRLEGYPAW